MSHDKKQLMLTSRRVQSVSQKSLYNFFTCSIEALLSATLGANPSTTLAASSSVIPLKTSIGTWADNQTTIYARKYNVARKLLMVYVKYDRTFIIMSGNFSARSSMLVPPFRQAIMS